MISFKEYISEVFNQPLTWKIKKNTKSELIFTFKTKDKKDVKVDMELLTSEKIKDRYDLNVKNDAWHIEFTVDSFVNITSGGEQFQIFSTVLDIFKYFIKEYKPVTFLFSSSVFEDSRVQLYDRFSDYIKKNFGYSVRYPKSDDEEYLFYIYTKKTK